MWREGAKAEAVAKSVAKSVDLNIMVETELDRRDCDTRDGGGRMGWVVFLG